MSVSVQVSVPGLAFSSLGCTPGSGSAGSSGDSRVNLWRPLSSSHWCPQRCPLSRPHQQHKGPNFSTSSPALLFLPLCFLSPTARTLLPCNTRECTLGASTQLGAQPLGGGGNGATAALALRTQPVAKTGLGKKCRNRHRGWDTASRY